MIEIADAIGIVTTGEGIAMTDGKRAVVAAAMTIARVVAIGTTIAMIVAGHPKAVVAIAIVMTIGVVLIARRIEDAAGVDRGGPTNTGGPRMT